MTTGPAGFFRSEPTLPLKQTGRDADRAGEAFADLIPQDPLDLERELARDGHLPFGAHEPAGDLVDARSYRGRRDPTIRELGAQIGRAIIAARLRNALPPRRTTYAERLEIARELRRGVR